MDTVIWMACGAAGLALHVLSRQLDATHVRARRQRRMRAASGALVDRTLGTVIGTVKALDEQLTAPLSGTPCVMHRSLVRVTHDTPCKAYVKPGEYVLASQIVEFVLDTGRREVIVSGSHAEMVMAERRVRQVQLARTTELLTLRSVEVDPLKARFFETVVALGARIVVQGIVHVEAANDAPGEHGYRDAPTTTRIIGDAAHPLAIAPA